MADTDRSTGFGPLESSKTALLSTYRSSGEPVSTPVSIAVAGGKAYFATSGSEANETMVKLSWLYHATSGKPQKRKIIARDLLRDHRA